MTVTTPRPVALLRRELEESFQKSNTTNPSASSCWDADLVYEDKEVAFYLGRMAAALNPKILTEEGISMVVNCAAGEKLSLYKKST